MNLPEETVKLLIEIQEKGVAWEFKNPLGGNTWVKGDSYFSPLRYLLNGYEIRKI